jgi:hypothetical protein
MRTAIPLLAVMIALSAGPVRAATNEQPVVLELFTSQGCSSCPPADALLKQLAATDPSLVPLSFHVHYWDYLGWKDPFSSTANTDRQRTYARALSAGSVFTPQMIVNGTTSAIGSNEGAIRQAIAAARQTPTTANVAIAPDADGRLTVTVMAKTLTHDDAEVWGVYFNHYRKTNVGAGENGGRTLENINNVTAIERLGTWSQADTSTTFPLDTPPEDGFAVIVQAPGQGRVLGAAAFVQAPASSTATY